MTVADGGVNMAFFGDSDKRGMAFTEVRAAGAGA